MDTKNRKLVRVKTQKGTGKKLAGIFKVSVQTVSYAINGKNNSDIARKIRKAAVELGGDPIYESSNN